MTTMMPVITMMPGTKPGTQTPVVTTMMPGTKPGTKTTMMPVTTKAPGTKKSMPGTKKKESSFPIGIVILGAVVAVILLGLGVAMMQKKKDNGGLGTVAPQQSQPSNAGPQ